MIEKEYHNFTEHEKWWNRLGAKYILFNHEEYKSVQEGEHKCNDPLKLDGTLLSDETQPLLNEPISQPHDKLFLWEIKRNKVQIMQIDEKHSDTHDCKLLPGTKPKP